MYSSDRKKIGFLRKTLPDYMVVKKGLIGLSSYLIPKSLAESMNKKGIRLRITAYEARHKYSHSKMKRLVVYGEVPKSAVQQRIVYDRLQMLRYGTTRNRPPHTTRLSLASSSCCPATGQISRSTT